MKYKGRFVFGLDRVRDFGVENCLFLFSELMFRFFKFGIRLSKLGDFFFFRDIFLFELLFLNIVFFVAIFLDICGL